MRARSFKNDFQTFKEDTTYTITRKRLYNYYIKNGKDTGELYPKSFPQKLRFEFGNNKIISTHKTANGTTFRYIYEGDFQYSEDLALRKLTFKEGYKVFHNPRKQEEYGWRTKLSKSISDSPKSLIEFEKLTNKLFDKAKISDEYDIYNGKYENIKGNGNQDITEGKHAKYFKNGWHEIAFDEDLITGNNKPSKINSGTQSPKEYAIKSAKKYNKKSLIKIDDFNTKTDLIKIDTASFGIDDIINPATAAQGKGRKEINKLAKTTHDFLYDQKKGGIYFNENGSYNGFGDGGMIAIIKEAPNLTAKNVEFI